MSGSLGRMISRELSLWQKHADAIQTLYKPITLCKHNDEEILDRLTTIARLLDEEVFGDGIRKSVIVIVPREEPERP